MSGSIWRSVSGGARPALEVAADEAVGRDAELERGLRGVVDGGGAVLLREREHAEDAPHAVGAVARVDLAAERADVRAGVSRAGEQLQRRSAACCAGRSASRDAMMRRAARGRCSRSSWPVFGSSSRTRSSVPLHLDARGRSSPAAPSSRRLDLDAAVEVHGALAVPVVAKRLDGQRRRCGCSSANIAATWRLVVPWMRVSAQRVSQRSR